MNETLQLVMFLLDERRYALSLGVVERIVAAVEITPLPQAPGIVLGVINIAGEVVAVLDVRRRLNLPARELQPADRFLIARTTRRRVVLVIDDALGVIELPPPAVTASSDVVPGMEQVQGIAQVDGDLVLIHDLEALLSLEDERVLDEAMTPEVGA
jgi:purine-binding chemotaxis protein CheW